MSDGVRSRERGGASRWSRCWIGLAFLAGATSTEEPIGSTRTRQQARGTGDAMGCDRWGRGCSGGEITMEQRMGGEITVECAADGEDLGSVGGWGRPRLRFNPWRRRRSVWRRKKATTSRVAVDCSGGGR
ncbi:Os02g0477200 [Oryza sativa Japonica Group]|uniref:Os02g0477200 protein n=1 Tax=Oryza sativa subsp. japonica TaxID=39947 RepID=A0A0P0VIZ6_ORYSJ|nr:Os02g0477200 [Oryza sativa Japonica Group]